MKRYLIRMKDGSMVGASSVETDAGFMGAVYLAIQKADESDVDLTGIELIEEPVPHEKIQVQEPHAGWTMLEEPLLTKREYIATHAMAAMLSAAISLTSDQKALVKMAVDCADALLKHLSEPTPPAAAS